ncbi:hypothetical protein CALVIDRAFT_535210 [Calocera viscosa TUFC12733]|uniref:Uncharacterized protein n=1 Tax=Calocera viscosa (strain TUFC12733) TaxID=1330018 RepID=A0A167PAD1_CALVF|nr:hypothetical protein CALVIDRAFT_535210 [Calocera viscosa TUFC12733]
MDGMPPDPCGPCLTNNIDCQYTAHDGRSTRFQRQNAVNETEGTEGIMLTNPYAILGSNNAEAHSLTTSFYHLNMEDATGNETERYQIASATRGPQAQYDSAASIPGRETTRGEGGNGRYNLQFPGIASSAGFDRTQEALRWEDRRPVAGPSNGHHYYDQTSSSQNAHYTTGVGFPYSYQLTSYERSAGNASGAYLPHARGNPGCHPVPQYYHPPPRHHYRNPELREEDEYAEEDEAEGTE